MNYNIEGEPLPVVICNLEANETMITEKGAMSWMTPNMKMETTSNGGIGKMFGRAFSGESMFQNRYTSMGGPGMIAFASCFPGCIRPFQIAPGQEIIAQKSAFEAVSSKFRLFRVSKMWYSAVKDYSTPLSPDLAVYGSRVCLFLSLQVQSDLLFQPATKPIKQDCRYSGSPVLHFVLNSMVLYFIYAIPFAVLYFHSISA